MTSRHVDFTHLHVHTNFSLQAGACKISTLVKKAAELKFPAIAMTDLGNMFGAVEFYERCMKEGLKPIIGVDGYLAPGDMHDRTPHSSANPLSNIVLLARNEAGYRNLMALVSRAYLEGFYYKPRFDLETLAAHAEGLLALTGGMRGALTVFLMQDQYARAKDRATQLLDIFGTENFFIELQRHGLEGEELANIASLKLAKACGLGAVATNNVYYLERDHAEAHDALMAIQMQTTINNPSRIRFERPEYYLKTAAEMQELFSDQPEALKNTIAIAERCNVEMDFRTPHLPIYELQGEETQDAHLRALCLAGLTRRYGTEPLPEVMPRLEHELGVIKQAGFESYFLVVWDFVRFAKEQGIPVGPGRGSAAGSIVSYCLGITDIEPLKYGLYFERFLNPDRVSFPDIDIDFCFERRQEVIDYMIEKYGKENVAQIITFGTMQAKAVIRDVGRAMDISYGDVDRIAKMVPLELEMTLAKALAQAPELKARYDNEPQIRKLIDIGKVLEGLTRHASTHAAGVAIADTALTNYTPLFKASDGSITTGYGMHDLETLKLLKIDLLGLRTLTVISKACKLIQEQRNITIDFDAMPLDDEETYALLARAESGGIFQLESPGMRDLLRKLRPQRFEDIAALLALYRPGPIGSGMLDDFIKRKRGDMKITYDHESLAPILKETYGIILYQEQVMQIASTLAGFSLAQADLLRRAMGKKIAEVMAQARTDFLQGCKHNHIKPRIAEKVFNLIEYFSGYGFNKAHSAAYAMISYRTAYLKAKYPVEFITALLTSEIGNMDKTVQYIEEAKRMGVIVLPPDINESVRDFSIAGPSIIRYALTAIKNVGAAAIESVVAERDAHGLFVSLQNFCERVDSRKVNRKSIESLIKCGAFDSLGMHRAQLLAVVDHAMETASVMHRDRTRGQMSFFDVGSAGSEAAFMMTVDDRPKQVREWHENERLAYEKELLGFYITGHPLAWYAPILERFSTTTVRKLPEHEADAVVTVGGMLTRIRHTTTKRTNERMAVGVLEDLSGDAEILIFPATYPQVHQHLTPNALIFVEGRINLRDEQPKIIVQKITPAQEAERQMTHALEIEVQTPGLDDAVLEELKDILTTAPGAIPVYLTMGAMKRDRVKIALGSEWKIDPRPELIIALEELVGKGQVALKR